MRKWNLIIDVARCEDCNNCFLACKDEHTENEWPPYALAQPRHGQRWINVVRKERGTFPMIDVAYLPSPCMHCDSAPCIEKAQNGAVYKRSDGIVIIDPQKATGQKELVQACPYNAISWNEALNIPQKCTFCAHLIDNSWTKPRCVQACPTGALEARLVEEPEMNRIITSEQLEVLHPELKTQPRIYYKNLYRFSRCFIGGSVAIDNNGVVDCAEGVTVTLYQGRERIAESTTDNYGDFKFDHLAKDTKDYSVVIEMAGLGQHDIHIPALATSNNLGTIIFSTAADVAANSESETCIEV